MEPLSVGHAPSMTEVLADPSLYDYTGGEAPSLQQLENRYTAQAVGHSHDGSQWWLNWVVIRRDLGSPVGYVQATVEDDGTWVLGGGITMVLLSDWSSIQTLRRGYIDDITEPLSARPTARIQVGRVFVMLTNWLFPLFAAIVLCAVLLLIH